MDNDIVLMHRSQQEQHTSDASDIVTDDSSIGGERWWVSVIVYLDWLAMT